MAAAVGFWFVTDNVPFAKRRFCKQGTGCSLLWDSTWTIVSKHLGSLAVGSFVIALCQVLRIALKMLDQFP